MILKGYRIKRGLTLEELAKNVKYLGEAYNELRMAAMKEPSLKRLEKLFKC